MSGSRTVDTDDTLVDPRAQGTDPAFDGEDGPLPSEIGRHRVIDRVGAGGMGVVFAAFDPELDRKIAIKLVRGMRAEGAMATQARARMKREAQSMAKLNHPNVITVYDVGEHDERLFIAMEFVEGKSVREWLDDSPRDWKAVLDVFEQAGAGLAAAHRAGLVHRDFKPDNAMIGDDGIVRVLDFGLAQSDTDRVGDDERAETIELDAPLVTRTGALAGTPAYMSPEQMLGEVADVRADQFSFAVSMFEALYREKPFRGDTVHALMLAVTDGEIRSPSSTHGVPQWLHRVVVRALETDPNNRWPSVDAMLAEIRRHREMPRKLLLAAAGAIAVGGAVLGLAGFWRAGLEVCTGAEQQLAEVWNDERREQVKARLAETGLSFAEHTGVRVVADLDAWTEHWAEAHHDACAATRVRKEQSEAVLDRRMACLHQRRATVRALVDKMLLADNKLAERADAITGSLPAPSACSDLAALDRTEPVPEEAGAASRVFEIRQRLFEARGVLEGGDVEGAAAIYEEGVEQAEAIGFDPLIAEALQQLASCKETLGQLEEAEAMYDRAYKLALTSGHDDAAHRSAIALGWLAAFTHGRAEDAKTWIDTARGLAVRAQLSEDHLATLDVNEAQVELEQGNFDRALELAKKGRERLDAVAEDDDPRLLEAYQVQAMAHARRAELPKARALFESAVALAAARGEEHPAVARARVNLAVVMKMMGENAAATQALEDALPVFIGAYGENHPHVATILFDLGASARDKGDFGKARDLLERTLKVRKALLGEEHPDVAEALSVLAGVAGDQGLYEQAITQFDRAIEIREKMQGEEHPGLEQALTQRGTALVRAGRIEDGIASIERAVKILETVHGTDHVRVARPLNSLGQALNQLDRWGDAVAPLERALALRAADPALAPVELANTQGALSQALWHSGGDRARARSLALTAQKGFRSSEGTLPETQAAIDAWVDKIGSDAAP